MANYVYTRAANAKFESAESNIETQVEKFKDIKIDKVYVDIGLSGGTTEINSLKNMLKDIKNGDNIYVANISRLTRDTELLLSLMGMIDHIGAVLHSDDLPGYELIAYMKKHYIEGGKENGKAMHEQRRGASVSYQK